MSSVCVHRSHIPRNQGGVSASIATRRAVFRPKDPNPETPEHVVRIFSCATVGSTLINMCCMLL